MSSSCIEDQSIQDNQWYRIASEMLAMADIQVNGNRPFDLKVKNTDFFKRVLQEGSLGLGESYMDGWWECDRLDIFSSALFVPVWKVNSPTILKILYVSPQHA